MHEHDTFTNITKFVNLGKSQRYTDRMNTDRVKVPTNNNIPHDVDAGAFVYLDLSGDKLFCSVQERIYRSANSIILSLVVEDVIRECSAERLNPISPEEVGVFWKKAAAILQQTK